MTRSKELRRIEEAIADRNESELRWALADCELRQKHTKTNSSRLYHLVKRIRAALDALRDEST